MNPFATYLILALWDHFHGEKQGGILFIPYQSDDGPASIRYGPRRDYDSLTVDRKEADWAESYLGMKLGLLRRAGLPGRQWVLSDKGEALAILLKAITDEAFELSGRTEGETHAR